MHWLKNIPLNYPKITLISGVILLLAAGVYGLGIFPKLSSDDAAFNAAGTESAAVNEAIKRDFGAEGQDSVVLFTRTAGNATVDDESYRNEVSRLLTELNPKTQNSYYSTGAENFVSKDRSATYAVVSLDGSSDEQAKKLIDFMNTARSDQLDVKVGGTIVGQHQVLKQTEQDLTRAETISLPIVALLLLVFFRSAVAALIPLVMALLTICGALAVSYFVQHFTAIDTYTINVITILGLGLSVDYSLLAVNRFREELAAGKSKQAAAKITARTAGRTIMFSGLTVILCLLSLLVFPVTFMHSISIGGVAAVLVAMIVSATLIPAALTIVGKNIDRWRLPIGRKAKSTGSFWERAAKLGVNHPWRTLLVGVVIVVAFVIPILEVKSAAYSYHVLPKESSAFAVGKAIEEDFDSKSPSITVLTTYEKEPSVADMCRTAELLGDINGVEAIMAPYMPSEQLSCQQMTQLEQFGMMPVALSGMSDVRVQGRTTKIDITPVGDINDKSTAELIRNLRNRTDVGVDYQVGGFAALNHDTLASYAKYAPIAIAIIIAAMVIILTISLGTIVIPLQAVIINSLGLTIAVGVLVMVYQFGWFDWLFHQTVMGGLNPAMPILICVIAFGLSMDYAVFLYSRMHEIYEKTGDYKKAILEGVQKTGPTITAAALVFIAVVAAFTTSHISMMQQIGLGLAVAVIVDAFVVRILFVPAVMQLFGRFSWAAPKWLKKIVIKHE